MRITRTLNLIDNCSDSSIQNKFNLKKASSVAAVLQHNEAQELYAGSGRLTEAARAAGLVCGPAVDWLYDPSSQSTSASPTQLCLDLGTQKDRDIVRQLIQENTTSWLHSGEPCTFWVTLGRSTARKFPQEWDRLRTKAVEHLHFSIDLAEYQHENGRMASRESPLCAGSWQTTDWCRLFLNGFQKNRYDSCRFGLVDEHGRPLKKPGIVAANRKMSHIARFCTCKEAGKKHGKCSGMTDSGPNKGTRRTLLAGAYTPAFCAAFVSDIQTSLSSLR